MICLSPWVLRGGLQEQKVIIILDRMGFEHVLMKLDPCVKDTVADCADHVARPVAHQLHLVLALLVAHQAHQVGLPAMALDVSVEMALLGKGFVAHAAGEGLGS